MAKVGTSQFQGYLIGQVIGAAVGALLLVVDDFAGFYYRSGYVDVWGYITLYPISLATILILLGIGGLLQALYAAIQSLQAKDEASPTFLKENARKTMLGAGFTAALAGVGAIIFIISAIINDYGDWWFGAGFYGAFIGGLLAALFGKMMYDQIES